MGNAFKFADPKRDNEVTLNIRFVNDELSIEVKDTGIGIAAEQQKEIFKEFVQAEGHASRSYEGSGLGLTMVKQFVELMNGTVAVKSEVGAGSMFTVCIPGGKEVHLTSNRPGHSQQPNTRGSGDVAEVISKVAAEEAMQKNLTAVANDQITDSAVIISNKKDGRYKVLVVDDNPINCEVLRDILEGSGYNVITALGGHECLDILRKQSVDLVLLDLMMPHLSGEDVIKQCKKEEKLRDIPIIVVTARASQDDRLYVLATGADEYLAKPIISDEIILRVRNTTARLELLHEKIEKSELKGQLSAAKQVQEALVPGKREESIAGFVIQEHFAPADDAGGDWYQYYHDKRSNRFYVFIADVTGHGVSASIVTGLTYGAIHGFFAEISTQSEQPALADVLKKMTLIVDRTISQISEESRRSMSAVFLGIDLDNGDGLLTSAGHP